MSATNKESKPPAAMVRRVTKYHHHVAFNRALKAARDTFIKFEEPISVERDKSRAAVAREMGVSVAEVEEERALLRKNPSVIELSPRLVIGEYVLGFRSRVDMIERLKTWPYSFRANVYANDDVFDELIGDWPGTWDQVEAAHLGGHIDEAAYAEISAAVEKPIY